MAKERWLEIDGCPGYRVSSAGRVKNADGKSLRPHDNGLGYKKVYITGTNGKRYEYVHRLVAKAFIENPEGKPCVNHIDNDPGNNRVENLEWCTKKENSEWMMKQGRNKRSAHWLELQAVARRRTQKPVRAVNLETGSVRFFESVNASKGAGFSPGLVSMCCNGKMKTYKGCVFEFASHCAELN